MVDRQLPHPRMAAQTLRQAAPSALPRLLALPADDGAPWLGLDRPRRYANYRSTISKELLELVCDFEEVGDGPVVSNVEDRRLVIRVHGDDRPRRLHAREVLHRARDPKSEVHLRLHGLAGLADLACVRHPAGVNDRAGDRE